MSMPLSARAASLASLRIPNLADDCVRSFGEYIRWLRSRDGRPMEELAPSAGLTVEEWKDIEEGKLRLAWEQVLMLGMVLNLGPSWTPLLKRLYILAWGHQP